MREEREVPQVLQGGQVKGDNQEIEVNLASQDLQVQLVREDSLDNQVSRVKEVHLDLLDHKGHKERKGQLVNPVLMDHLDGQDLLVSEVTEDQLASLVRLVHKVNVVQGDHQDLRESEDPQEPQVPLVRLVHKDARAFLALVVLPAQLEPRESVVNLDFKEREDLQVKGENLVSQDHREKVVVPDQQDQLGLLERGENVDQLVRGAHQDRQETEDSPDLMASLVQLDLLGKQESLVELVFQGSVDRLGLQAVKVHGDSLEQLVRQVRRVKGDHLEVLDHQDHREKGEREDLLVSLELKDQQDHQDLLDVREREANKAPVGNKDCQDNLEAQDQEALEDLKENKVKEDHLDHLERLDRLVREGCLEVQVLLDLLVKGVLLDLLAHLAHWGLQELQVKEDSPEKRVKRELQARLASQDPKVKEVFLVLQALLDQQEKVDHQDVQEHKDHVVKEVRLVHQDKLDNLDHLEKQDPKDQEDQEALPDNLDQQERQAQGGQMEDQVKPVKGDNLAYPELLVREENQVLQGNQDVLAHQDHRDQQDQQAYQETGVSQDLMEKKDQEVNKEKEDSQVPQVNKEKEACQVHLVLPVHPDPVGHKVKGDHKVLQGKGESLVCQDPKVKVVKEANLVVLVPLVLLVLRGKRVNKGLQVL